MNHQFVGNRNEVAKENVLAGIAGAFLFSLAGGVLWFLLYLISFIASISGLVAVICAIKGYAIFAKKESTKGIIISVVVALLVMVVAWYCGLAYDIVEVYKYGFEIGEIDYTVDFFVAIKNAHRFLLEPDIGINYFIDLGITIVLCAIGAGGYVVNKIKKTKAQAQNPAAAGNVTASVLANQSNNANEVEKNTETPKNNIDAK